MVPGCGLNAVLDDVSLFLPRQSAVFPFDFPPISNVLSSIRESDKEEYVTVLRIVRHLIASDTCKVCQVAHIRLDRKTYVVVKFEVFFSINPAPDKCRP